VNVSAHERGDGSVHGQLHQKNYSTDVARTGEVLCLRVTDNRAVIGIRVTRSNDPDRPEGSGEYWFFSDNGRPSDDKDAATMAPAATPEVCPAPVEPFQRPTFSGNYTIHDAQD